MVCLVINSNKSKVLRNVEELITILRKMSKMTSIVVNFNTQRTNVILGEKYEVLWGKGYITDYLAYGKGIEKELKKVEIEIEKELDQEVRETEDNVESKNLNKDEIRKKLREEVAEKGEKKDIEYRISPLSFYQINPIQTEKLYALVMEYGNFKEGELVWDLYCGIGTISLFLSQKAQKVIGVEVVSEAIRDAKENARINGIRNVDFIVGKSEEVFVRYYEDKPDFPDVVVLDPPRKGCEEALLATIAKVKPGKVIVVSCDSATLARDLKFLCGNGYELRKVRAVDLFPMTVHVECVTLLVRSEWNERQKE